MKLKVIDGGREGAPDEDYIKDVFGKGGFLSKKFPGYEPRMGQISIARAIDDAIRNGKHLIAEGPTGVGKSFAYSVPAAYHASHGDKRICIVTANNNLQRQIYSKDLATLAKAVPWDFKYAIRKGLGNYLCARDFFEEQRHLQVDDGFLSSSDTDAYKATIEWANTTKTGDFEDSPGPSKKIWRGFSTSNDECDRRKCVSYDDCFVGKARDKASAANIIVTNYHLLFLHLKLGPESKILPPFDVIIMDEAHRAAKIARDFFGTEIGYGSLYRCVTNMHMVKVRGFGEQGKKLRGSILEEISRLWNELGRRARARDVVLHQGWTIESEKLENLLKDAGDYYRKVAGALGVSDDMQSGGKKTVMQAQRAVEGKEYLKLSKKCIERQVELFDFRAGNTKGNVYFIEGSGKETKGKYVKLKSKAIEVGGAMHHGLFKRFPTVIQTSATLAIKGGNSKSEFQYVRNEMGMGGLDNVMETSVASPFDWRQQGLLVIPKTMPEPIYQDPEEKWEKAICEHFEKVIGVVRGRTMGLFTSYRMMEMVRDHLKKRCRYEVLTQGEATNRELAERFHSKVDSVLLGTESFSEGISIEGESCTCVILDKIPFTSGKDPLMIGIEKMRKESGKTGRDISAFESYSLPEAIISFKQRVGRLIRTVNDVGVVVVLDKRLHTKKYRKQFTSSVPFGAVYDSIDDIAPFLRRVGAL